MVKKRNTRRKRTKENGCSKCEQEVNSYDIHQHKDLKGTNQNEKISSVELHEPKVDSNLIQMSDTRFTEFTQRQDSCVEIADVRKFCELNSNPYDLVPTDNSKQKETSQGKYDCVANEREFCEPNANPIQIGVAFLENSAHPATNQRENHPLDDARESELCEQNTVTCKVKLVHTEHLELKETNQRQANSADVAHEREICEQNTISYKLNSILAENSALQETNQRTDDYMIVAYKNEPCEQNTNPHEINLVVTENLDPKATNLNSDSSVRGQCEQVQNPYQMVLARHSEHKEASQTIDGCPDVIAYEAEVCAQSVNQHEIAHAETNAAERNLANEVYIVQPNDLVMNSCGQNIVQNDNFIAGFSSGEAASNLYVVQLPDGQTAVATQRPAHFLDDGHLGDDEKSEQESNAYAKYVAQGAFIQHGEGLQKVEYFVYEEGAVGEGAVNLRSEKGQLTEKERCVFPEPEEEVSYEEEDLANEEDGKCRKRTWQNRKEFWTEKELEEIKISKDKRLKAFLADCRKRMRVNKLRTFERLNK